MTAGVLLALTLPGVVLLLVVVAIVEHAASRLGRRGLLGKTPRGALSASGMDVLSAALSPGREVDLEQRRVERLLRDDDEVSGAPPHWSADLDRGVVRLSYARIAATEAVGLAGDQTAGRSATPQRTLRGRSSTSASTAAPSRPYARE